jgi:predicted nucleotidyltransferase
METLTKEETAALKELKSALNGLLGNRLVKFVLYGSKARGDYDRDSDTDVGIIVRGLTRELKKEILDKIVEIEFEYLTPLSTLYFPRRILTS